MNSATAICAALQVIGAMLIFVAFYLALVLCGILILVAGELISEHASLVQEYGVKSMPLETSVHAEISSKPRKSAPEHVVCRLSDGSKDAARRLPLALVRQGRQ